MRQIRVLDGGCSTIWPRLDALPSEIMTLIRYAGVQGVTSYGKLQERADPKTTLQLLYRRTEGIELRKTGEPNDKNE